MGIVDTERERCRQFKNGLTAEIRTPVITNTVYNDYTKLVNEALGIERSLKGKRSSSVVSIKEEREYRRIW